MQPVLSLRKGEREKMKKKMRRGLSVYCPTVNLNLMHQQYDALKSTLIHWKYLSEQQLTYTLCLRNALKVKQS